MNNLKPNGQRANTAIILIWIVLILEIVSFISSYLQYNLLQSVVNGFDVSMEAAEANDRREQIIGILYMIAYLISSITFIQWFRRAYYNLHTKIDYLKYDEGWAAGCWFVPIINLFRPFQIMKELYVETKNFLEKQGLILNQKFSANNLGLWWTLWIISNFIGQFVGRYALKAESLDELTNATIISMVGNVIGVPLALITIKIIKDYSIIEPLMNDLKNQDEIIEQQHD